MEQSLDQDEKRTIFLVSKEGKRFEIDRSYASLSEMVKTTLLDEEATEISLKEISADTLALVVEYLNHRKGVPPEKSIQRPLRRDCKTAKEFVNDDVAGDFIDRVAKDAKTIEEVADLRNLILAANYLAIDPLLHLCCAKYSHLCFKSPKLLTDTCPK